MNDSVDSVITNEIRIAMHLKILWLFEFSDKFCILWLSRLQTVLSIISKEVMTSTKNIWR